MSELLLLQAARLKGRLAVDAASTSAGIPAAEARAGLEALLSAGHAKAAGTAFRLTPQGRERLAELLAEERDGVDQAALDAAYHRFDEVNTELKAIVTAWQMKDDSTPNDHADSTYDLAVIDRLYALDERFTPLLAEMITVAPRLAPYRTRFATAVAKLRDGDHTFVARPITDSYHTVWFELHEELIGLLGRVRIDEAKAGRAV